jgi:hypothetical protein
VTGRIVGYARTHVIAFVALFVALGGGAYAASGLVSGGTITGCAKSHGGPLTIVRAGHKCPRHQVALTFDERGPAGKTGGAGPPGPRGATGPTGTEGTGTTVFTDPPGWAPTTTSAFLSSSISTDWDEYYDENSSVTDTFQALPVTLAQLDGSAAQLSAFSFCYGAGGPAGDSKITNVEVDAVNEPATITSGTPPGGTTTTPLIKQTTTLDTHGCPSYTPSSSLTLGGTTFLVAHLTWSGTTAGGNSIYLGRTTYTFTP